MKKEYYIPTIEIIRVNSHLMIEGFDTSIGKGIYGAPERQTSRKEGEFY